MSRQKRNTIDKMILPLSQPEAQSEFPEGGSRFTKESAAEEAAVRVFGADVHWRVEPIAIGGESFYVLKFWPKGRPPICAKRRWAVFVKPQARRANGIDDQPDE